ncbi:Peroxisome biogenesis protein 22 [Diplonema papillatum]|nr:Peroxisome biogenesis protein 22 [Diplonema papillatum]
MKRWQKAALAALICGAVLIAGPIRVALEQERKRQEFQEAGEEDEEEEETTPDVSAGGRRSTARDPPSRVPDPRGVMVVVSLSAVKSEDDAVAVRGLAGPLLYVVEQVESDEAEAAARARFAALKMPASFPQHHFVCCSTAVGRKAVFRQISPAFAIDTDEDNIRYLQPHLQNVCLVTAVEQRDLFTSPTLAEYLLLVSLMAAS